VIGLVELVELIELFRDMLGRSWIRDVSRAGFGVSLSVVYDEGARRINKAAA
jgi:hypothetical protein